MPTIDGLDMQPTLEWYEQNIDEMDERISACFINHHHRLPTRIGQLIGNIKGINGHTLASVGLRDDDIAQVFGCFNPGFWQRSVFAGLSICPPLWFTKEMLQNTEGALPTKNIAQALSPSHHVPAFTRYVTHVRPDPLLDFGAVIYLSHLSGAVSPDVRRVVAIECLMHELTHTLVTPILKRVDDNMQSVKLSSGEVIDEFALLEGINTEYELLAEGISHYAEGYKQENSVVGLQEEICESVAALLLDFVFCEHGAIYNFKPFSDRARMRQCIIDLITAYRA